MIDMFFVSVLLDAGAGDVWRFKEPGTENTYNRSEGIGVASLYMCKAGAFSSTGQEFIVDGMHHHALIAARGTGTDCG